MTVGVGLLGPTYRIGARRRRVGGAEGGCPAAADGRWAGRTRPGAGAHRAGRGGGVGSAHDDAELEVLNAAARYRLTAGQAELDLGLGFAAAMPAGGGVVRWRSRVADGVSGGCPDPCLPGARVRAGRERGRGVRSVGAGPAEVREGIVAAAPCRGLRRARLETLVPRGSRPARCVLTDRDRVPGAGSGRSWHRTPS